MSPRLKGPRVVASVRAGPSPNPGLGPGRSPRRRTCAGERGSITAEFAAVVPAVLLVLAFCLGAVQVLTQQLRLSDAAADAARSLARGDGDAVTAARVQRAVGAAQLSREQSGDFVCVALSASAAFGPAALAGVMVSGRGCALKG